MKESAPDSDNRDYDFELHYCRARKHIWNIEHAHIQELFICIYLQEDT